MKNQEIHKAINEMLVTNLYPEDEVMVGIDGGQLVIVTSDADVFRKVTLQALDDVLLEANFDDAFESRFSHMACDFEIADYNGEAAVVITGIPVHMFYQLM